MKTANDFLQEAYKVIEAKQSSRSEDVDPALLNAIEEYARREAIEFGKWISDNFYIHNGTYWYISYTEGDYPDMVLTDEQLYKKWKDENNK